MPIRWFGVKTVYRTSAVGKPRAIDDHYDPEGTLVEERVVLFRARDHDDAIEKGEREAEKYTADRHTNPYGQSVISRRLRAIESFKLYEEPDKGTEVWSATRVVPVSVPNKRIIDTFFGDSETKAQLRRRKKYLNREFSGDVKTPNGTAAAERRIHGYLGETFVPRRSRLSARFVMRTNE